MTAMVATEYIDFPLMSYRAGAVFIDIIDTIFFAVLAQIDVRF